MFCDYWRCRSIEQRRGCDIVVVCSIVVYTSVARHLLSGPPLSHLPQAVGLDGVQRAELAVEVEVDLDVEVAVVLAVGPAPEDALRRDVGLGVGEG